MTKCTIPVAKKLFEDSKKRAESLKETMLVSKEGEVFSETIANAEKAIQLLADNDYDALSSVDKRRLVNNAAGAIIREHLTDVFKGSIGFNTNSTSTRQDLVLTGATYTNNKLTVDLTTPDRKTTWSYTFDENSNVSDVAIDGTRLFIPQFKESYNSVKAKLQEIDSGLSRQEEAVQTRQALTTINKLLADDVDMDTLLGAANTINQKAFNYKKASERQNYVHGSKEDMKNVLADLHAITGDAVDTDTYNYYNELLDSTHEHFFRDMNLYINENTNHTAGWVDIDKEHILLNTSSKRWQDMSNEEVYMHEVIHTMVLWALRQSGFVSSKLRNRLDYLFKTAQANISVQEFIAGHPNLTTKEAKERYEYIFNSKNANDEFIAFALTNPAFKKLLQKVKLTNTRQPGIFNAIKGFLSDLLNAVMGNYSFLNRTAALDKEVHVLAFKLATINQKATDTIKTEGFLFKVRDFVDSLEGTFEEWVHKVLRLLDTKSIPQIPKNMSRMQKILFTAGFFVKGIYNKNYRHMVGTYFSMLGVKPNSAVREIIRSIVPIEDTSKPQFLGLKTSNIDALKNTQVTAALKSILDKFINKPTEEEEVAATLIYLESNASVLFHKNKNQNKGYTEAQIHKLLTDVGFRKTTIARVEARIRHKNKKRANWIIGQAGGLGKLMATGKGHEAQNTNSRSIVLGHNSNQRYALDTDLLSMVEELASLRALDFQNKNDLFLAAELLRKEPKAIRNIVNLYNNFRWDSAEHLFADDQVHMLEGYTKQLLDDTIDVRYEPLMSKAEMEKKGYTLVSKLEKDNLIGGIPLGIFVSSTYAQAERLRGAVSLGGLHGKGLSLREIRFKQFETSKKHAQIYFESDKIEMTKKAKDINKRLEDGESFMTIKEGAVPILDAHGQAIDYRHMMDKDLKAKYLGQNRQISSVLSKTIGTIIDKTSRNEHNKNILDFIKQQIANEYDNPKSPDNLREYTLISPTSTNADIRALYNMLPQSFRDYAKSRADEALPIPSALMDLYFGYKHHKFTDLYGINKLPNGIKHIIDIFEAYFQDLVKIAKGNILLKMPFLLVSNIWSNILFALNNRMSIAEIVSAYIASFRDVKHFMNNHKELEAKKIELASLTQDYMVKQFSPQELEDFNTKVKLLKDQIARLDKEMQSSDIKELFDLGLYQSVVEDVEMYKLGDTNRISGGMDKLLSKTPTVVKTPLQWLYLSKETAWYKVNQEVLQLSDLVARDVMNRKMKMIEKAQADGKKELPIEYRKRIGLSTPKKRVLSGAERDAFFEFVKQNRQANLLNYFVNYTLPNSKSEEYLNRIGILMFTKYLKRIQVVNTQMAIKYPIRTLMLLAASAFIPGMDLIQNQTLLAKAMDNNDFGLFGVLPIYWPTEVVSTVVNPPLINLVTSF